MADDKTEKPNAFKIINNPPLDVDGKEIYRFLTSQYLHQNQLSWSRLQTAFAIEAGLLAWFFSANTPTSVIVIGMILGSIAIWLLYQLVLRDWEVRDQNNEKLDVIHEPLQIRLIKTAQCKWLHGQDIARYLTFGSIIVNLVLAVLRLYCIA